MTVDFPAAEWYNSAREKLREVNSVTQEELDGLLTRAIAQARAVGIPVSSRIRPAVRLNRRACTDRKSVV